MQTTPVWRSRPVFITSTFKDFHAERDHLRHFVFPVLEERLKALFYHLEPIDLRWGVETRREAEEATKELLILKVCLDEIERSRPFLIGLLGDRYGWVPPPERIEAAAQEKGLQIDARHKSVTALEVEYGILSDPEERRRSRFYFREPLPYDQMDPDIAAQYSDLYHPEAAVRENYPRLQQLKQAIREAMGDRVHPYAAVWDPERQRVTGLESWGEQVLEHLWEDILAEIREYPQVSLETWQDQERYTLEQTVARLSRDFVGREGLLTELVAWAVGEDAPRPELEGKQGLCLVGAPGVGKSALFAQLYQRLRRKGVLVLAHAAGISPASQQVERLLRRWVGELVAYLGEEDPSAGITDRRELEETFAHFLSRASQGHRVVCLLDALNQFERTPAGRHLTWLPSLWPRNARLIATTLPGTESEALARKPWVLVERLELLTPAEAARMAAALCQRHHKVLAPDILQVLLAKRLPDGQLAAGYPLWLELAVNELLLLDEDDFVRMERTFSGSPEEKLHQLLLGVAEQLPPDIPALYGFLLERTEKVYGRDLAREFVNLLAVTRSGLRVQDLAVLLPKWEELAFAHLRRGFRAHLVQRGPLEQWDFGHLQMREAVFRRHLADPEAIRAVHHRIAGYLLTLDTDDPLRQEELMFHLIGADDRAQAAQLYAFLSAWAMSGDSTAQTALDAATRTLAAHILAGVGQEQNQNLDWVLALPEIPTNCQESFCICKRYIFELFDALSKYHTIQKKVLIKVKEILERIVSSEPDNLDYKHALSINLFRLGIIYRKEGFLEKTLMCCNNSIKILDELVVLDPMNIENINDLKQVYEEFISALMGMGQVDKVLAAYHKAVDLLKHLGVDDRNNQEMQLVLATVSEITGNIAYAMGTREDALSDFLKSLAIRKRLAPITSSDKARLQDLAWTLRKLGDICLSLGRIDETLTSFQESLRLFERLSAQDPDNDKRQEDLAIAYERMGDIYLILNRGEDSLKAYKQTFALRERLAATDPENPDRRRKLRWSQYKLGNVYVKLRRIDEAIQSYKYYLAEELVILNPEEIIERARKCRDFSGGLLLANMEYSGLCAYCESLAILEYLAENKPTSRQVHEWLAFFYDDFAYICIAIEWDEEALRFRQRALSIWERLAAAGLNGSQGRVK